MKMHIINMAERNMCNLGKKRRNWLRLSSARSSIPVQDIQKLALLHFLAYVELDFFRCVDTISQQQNISYSPYPKEGTKM